MRSWESMRPSRARRRGLPRSHGPSEGRVDGRGVDSGLMRPLPAAEPITAPELRLGPVAAALEQIAAAAASSALLAALGSLVARGLAALASLAALGSLAAFARLSAISGSFGARTASGQAHGSTGSLGPAFTTGRRPARRRGCLADSAAGQGRSLSRPAVLLEQPGVALPPPSEPPAAARRQIVVERATR